MSKDDENLSRKLYLVHTHVWKFYYHKSYFFKFEAQVLNMIGITDAEVKSYDAY